MNYSVHAVMYSYFALTSCSRFRLAALRVAPLITALQISQFAWGTVINVFAAVAYASPAIGCAIRPPILYIAAGLDAAYGALFVRLFVRRYLRGGASGRSRAAKVGEGGALLSNGAAHHQEGIGSNGLRNGIKAV